MPKHIHLQRMEEQIDNHLIQVRAYKIHEEKGGSDLDNWLEAEQILRNPTNLLATADRIGSGGAA